jgi:hypothetical protein
VLLVCLHDMGYTAYSGRKSAKVTLGSKLRGAINRGT